MRRLFAAAALAALVAADAADAGGADAYGTTPADVLAAVRWIEAHTGLRWDGRPLPEARRTSGRHLRRLAGAPATSGPVVVGIFEVLADRIWMHEDSVCPSFLIHEVTHFLQVAHGMRFGHEPHAYAVQDLYRRETGQC